MGDFQYWRLICAAALAMICSLAAGPAGAESWLFESPESENGPAYASIGAYPEFAVSIGCSGDQGGGAMAALALDTPEPLLIFVGAQGFIRDLNTDLDQIGPLEVDFVVDGRDVERIAFEYRSSSGDFVGAAAYDSTLIEALQSGEIVELFAVDFDAYGVATLDGSRKAIDLLRDYCPGMKPSRRPGRRRGSTISVGPIEVELPIGSGGDASISITLPPR